MIAERPTGLSSKKAADEVRLVILDSFERSLRSEEILVSDNSQERHFQLAKMMLEHSQYLAKSQQQHSNSISLMKTFFNGCERMMKMLFSYTLQLYESKVTE